MNLGGFLMYAVFASGDDACDCCAFGGVAVGEGGGELGYCSFAFAHNGVVDFWVGLEVFRVSRMHASHRRLLCSRVWLL